MFSWFKKEDNQNNVRKDGWNNILTGIGANKGRVNTTQYCPGIRLDRQTLTDIYTSDGIGRRIVNIVVDDSIRDFIECDEDLLVELQRLKAKQVITDAASWARLYGGSIIIAFADDGQDLEQPLNLKRVRKLVHFKAYDRWQISHTNADLSIDYYSEYYGQPELFTVSPYNGIPFKVHRSRCHVFSGDRAPDSVKIQNQHWDSSVLQSVYDSLRNYGSTMNASAEIVQDFIQTILSVNGLTNMIVQGQDDLITERANLVDLTRSVTNTVFLDAENESYSKHASSVAGLADLWDRFSEAICATTGIPITKLFGRSPGGLNSTGEHDIGNWFDIVQAYRSDEIQPCINWMLEIVEAQSMWKGVRPKSYDWSFPSLKTPNEEEWANIKHKTAQTDQIYMNLGAIDPAYLFKLRYADGDFKTDVEIDPEYMDKLAEDDRLEILPDNADLVQVNAAKVNKDSVELVQLKADLRMKLYNKLGKIF